LTQDLKDQVRDLVHQIDHLNQQIAEHWSHVQKLITANQIDDAISILNAYFRLKLEHGRAETRLAGILSGYFGSM
jgi:hypothetical protein